MIQICTYCFVYVRMCALGLRTKALQLFFLRMLGVALRAACAGVIAKTTAVLNCNFKPWKSGEFKRQKEDGLTKFVAAEGQNRDLWEDLRERVAFDLGVRPDTLPSQLAEAFQGHDTFINRGEYAGCLATSTLLHQCLRAWPWKGSSQLALDLPGAARPCTHTHTHCHTHTHRHMHTRLRLCSASSASRLHLELGLHTYFNVFSFCSQGPDAQVLLLEDSHAGL